MILIILLKGDIEELISAKLEKEATVIFSNGKKKKFLLKTEDGVLLLNLEKQCSKFLKKEDGSK